MFELLVDEIGDYVIGVILLGIGGDGVCGLKVIKSVGGFVFV